MPHPFPGMNPYVESRELWPSTRRLLMTTLADDLSERLSGAYDVWEEEDVYIETDPIRSARTRASVTTTTRGSAPSSTASASTTSS